MYLWGMALYAPWIASLALLAIGYALGLRQGRNELRAFQAGQKTHQGGPCWVKAQLPPHAQD